MNALIPCRGARLFDALARLGTNADEVADRLCDAGIRGVRGKAGGCPIARYAEHVLHDSSLAYIGLTRAALYVQKPLGSDEVFVDLPVPIQIFVRRFDRGMYPLMEVPFFMDHK